MEVKKYAVTVAEYNPGWRTHRAERDVWVPPGGTGASGRSEKYREMIWETDALSGLESLGKETRGHRWGQVSKRPRFGAPVRHAPDPHIFAENVCATQDDGEDVLLETDGTDILRDFVHGPGIDDYVAMHIPAGQANAGTYFCHADGLGSVTDMTLQSDSSVQTLAGVVVGGIVMFIGAMMVVWDWKQSMEKAHEDALEIREAIEQQVKEGPPGKQLQEVDDLLDELNGCSESEEIIDNGNSDNQNK